MDMFTSYGHIKKTKWNHRFFYDFSLIESVQNANIRGMNGHDAIGTCDLSRVMVCDKNEMNRALGHLCAHIG